jgi:hypothetical protein
MRYLGVAAVAALTLSACGTLPFEPVEYPLRAGLISSFPAKGQATVVNAQPSTDQIIVYSYGGSKLASNLHAITEVMVTQAQKEIAKAAQPAAGTPKTIELTVNSLRSTYVAFFWNSKMEFVAKLGDGQVLTKTVLHSSGVLALDLDGCIAEGVLALLNDEKVRAYLGS